MRVNQISTILNSVFKEITGTSAVIQEDLSNIVEVGRVITSSTQWGDNFDKYVGAIIDKVGKTIFVDRVYTAAAPNIRKSSQYQLELILMLNVPQLKLQLMALFQLLSIDYYMLNCQKAPLESLWSYFQ